MKYMLIFMLVLSLSACATRTEYGDCVGVNGQKNPDMRYQYSTWNIAMGIIFFEMIVPPVIVAADGLECPVGPNPKK